MAYINRDGGGGQPYNEQDIAEALAVVEPQDEYEDETPVPEPGFDTVLFDDLAALVDSENAAEGLDDDTLKTLGTLVVEEARIDDDSRSQWKEDYADALKLARMPKEAKDFPWPNSANIKYPLITQAAIQFNARAYPAIMSNGRIVKGRVIGPDPEGKKADRANRIGLHMSYQLTEQMVGWEDELDAELLILPVVGTTFKKTYRDYAKGVNVSEYVNAEDCIVNYRVKSIERAPRITQPFELYPNEIESYIRTGTFRKFEYDNSTGVEVEELDDADTSLSGDDGAINAQDSAAPHLFYEQHRWYDLDEDGYEEPWIVTVHVYTSTVVRITARFDPDGITRNAEGHITRIKAVNHWTVKQFLPSLDGSIYGLGFGLLMGHMNETVNATINQLLDAGTNQNTGGGFISKAVQLGKNALGAVISFMPGEWKQVGVTGATLRESIVPRETPQPSNVLFKLLELMISTSKMISNSDLLAGEMPPANTPATTTVTLIEQSLKVYSGVYKRIYRALREEFKKLHRLNRLYLTDEEYFTVVDEPNSVARADYEDRDCDVIPECDPNNMSDAVTMLRAQTLMDFVNDPEFDSRKIKMNLLEAMSIPDAKSFMRPKEELAAMTDPEIELKKGELAVKEARQTLQETRFQVERLKTMAEMERIKAEIGQLNANATLLLAKAESEDAATTIESLKMLLDQRATEMNKLIDRLNKMGEMMMGGGAEGEDTLEGSRSVVGEPGNIGMEAPGGAGNTGETGGTIGRGMSEEGVAG